MAAQDGAEEDAGEPAGSAGEDRDQRGGSGDSCGAAGGRRFGSYLRSSLSCRTGPLGLPPRQRRPFCGGPDSRGHFVACIPCLALMIFVGPPVGRKEVGRKEDDPEVWGWFQAR